MCSVSSPTGLSLSNKAENSGEVFIFLGHLYDRFHFAWWGGLGCGGKSEPTGFHTHNFGTDWTWKPSNGSSPSHPQAQQFLTREPESSKCLQMQLFQLQLRISERKPNNCVFSLLSRHQLLSRETVALFSSSPYHWPLLLTKQKYHAC